MAKAIFGGIEIDTDGDVDLSGTAITTLPDNLKVGGQDLRLGTRHHACAAGRDVRRQSGLMPTTTSQTKGGSDEDEGIRRPHPGRRHLGPDARSHREAGDLMF
jgi:hypothetical protein